MTMHLAQGLTTLRTQKPSAPKLTKTKRKKLQEELRLYNKKMKQQGRHSEQLDFDSYVLKLHGRLEKVPSQDRQPATEVKTFEYKLPDTSRNRQYRSHDSGKGIAAKAERKEYTGTLVKGIATMHKSNAVPVISDEEAESISKMRRN